MKILAIKWRRLGDTILWTSALQALRDHFPQAELDIAFPAAYADLFAADRRFQHRFPLPDRLSARVAWVRQVRRRHYDWALAFHAGSRTLPLTWFAGAGAKILHHHRRRPRRYFSDRVVPHLGKLMPAHERDLNVVRALGWEGAPPPTRIEPDSRWKEAAARHLTALGWRPGQPLVGLGISASRPAKQWPLEKYARLTELLSAHARIAIFAESETVFRGQGRFREFLEKRAWFIPTPRLSDLMGYLSHATCYVGPDSGVKHLACALGVPTITLFGPESLGEWHFYPGHTALQKPLLCRTHDSATAGYAWCGEEVCPLSSHACMNLIAPEEVATLVEPYLTP